MMDEIVIRSYLPYQEPNIAEKINHLHRKTLDTFKFDYPSNNKSWIDKLNVIGFYAEHVKTKEILCAYRHEFIFSKEEISNTPFLSGIDTSQNLNLINQLNTLIDEGAYSETCGFWAPPTMAYKKSDLAKYLFSYGILASFLNGSANILGLAPLKLVDYYGHYGLTTDNKVPEIINYSNQSLPSKFVLYDNDNDNKEMYSEIKNHLDFGIELKLAPYQNVYLHMEEPLVIFNKAAALPSLMVA